MSHDPILHLLGIARKAGRVEVGEEPVGAVCRARRARLVLLAEDAAPNTRRRAAHFARTGSVPFLEAPFSKAEIGALLGRSSCAMLALTDPGFAAAALEKLAARDPERCAPAAQTLREQAGRVLQRQRERRQHEKNLREGRRKKPRVPPPAEHKSAHPKPPARKKGPAPAPKRAVRPAKPGPERTPNPGGRGSAGRIPKKRGGTPT